MTCSTCQIIVSPEDVDKLPATSEAEEDMLVVTTATLISRLACQTLLGDDLTSLTVYILGAISNSSSYDTPNIYC